MPVPMTYMEMAGIVAVCLGLLELIKFLVNKLVNRASEDRLLNIEEAVEETRAKSKLIYDMHNKYDVDGTPIWYVPRSWAETQKEIIDTCHQISTTQQSIAETLKRLEYNGRNGK